MGSFRAVRVESWGTADDCAGGVDRSTDREAQGRAVAVSSMRYALPSRPRWARPVFSGKIMRIGMSRRAHCGANILVSHSGTEGVGGHVPSKSGTRRAGERPTASQDDPASKDVVRRG